MTRRSTIRTPDPGHTFLAGAHCYVCVVTGFVLRVTEASNLRMFDTGEQGLAWLQSPDTTQAF